jgi:hypothetical protein
VTLLSAILALIYGFSVERTIQASTLFLQSAFGPLAGQIISLLVSGMKMTFLAFSALLFLASILLYAVGRNLSKASALTKRVTELENRLVVYELRKGEIFNETLA